ncbi:vacuolar protein sorting protein 66 [Scheffersomyces xylosifermentans]|uniref:vacuolar protein sorting protein 66 n=1 Tax=Scheffersomyces xylosifermentans TaxID=1304137 RepID=UPI00315C6D8F
MEKFSSWRDKGTGISPFMPVPFPLEQEKSTVKKWLQLTVKTLVFLVKLPFLILFTLIYYLTSFKPLAQFVLLILFGFNNLDFSVENVKKSNTIAINKNKPGANEVIVVNYVSPLDGLIYAVISKTWNWRNIKILIPVQSGELYEYSIWSLILHAFDNTHLGTPIGDSDHYKSKVVFLLLEGTTSNNKALLPFVKLKPSYTFKGFTVKSLVVKIKPAYFTLPIPTSKIGYLFELLTNLDQLKNNYIRLKSYQFDSFAPETIKSSFEMNSLNAINQNLNIAEKENFIAYYNNHDIKKTL